MIIPSSVGLRVRSAILQQAFGKSVAVGFLGLAYEIPFAGIIASDSYIRPLAIQEVLQAFPSHIEADGFPCVRSVSNRSFEEVQRLFSRPIQGGTDRVDNGLDRFLR